MINVFNQPNIGYSIMSVSLTHPVEGLERTVWSFLEKSQDPNGNLSGFPAYRPETYLSL